MPPTPPTLTGRHVQLEPLSLDHVPHLVDAAAIDRTTYGYTLVPDTPDAMAAYVERLVADRERGSAMPFAQRRLSDGAVVGCTRYMEFHHWRGRDDPDEVEIGGTWLAADAQRSAVNTEAKLLLLTQAFDVWDVWRVTFCTDARNERSRAAIARIGATFEGILRSHRPVNAVGVDPAPRDTAVFSVIAAEWPAVGAALRSRLAERPVVDTGGRHARV